MAYRKYGNKFRRNTRRFRKARPWYNRSYTPMQIAQAALRGVNKVRGLVNSEMYKWDVTQTNNLVDATGNVLHITAIPQGDDDQARTGNSVYVRSVNIKGTIRISAAETTGTIVRLALVMDTQQIGDTAPTFSTIYESSNVRSHLNNTTVGRFKILRSKEYKLSSINPRIFFEYNVPMRHHIRYNGSLGSDIQKGGLYWVSVSDNSVNVPTMDIESRTSYHDN